LRVAEVPPADLALPSIPGISLLVGDDQVTVAWALPPETSSPALDVLVLQRTAGGIDPQKKLLPLSETSGRIGLLLPGCIRPWRPRAPYATAALCPSSDRLARQKTFYTTPWSIIESATLTKPAMLAPIT